MNTFKPLAALALGILVCVPAPAAQSDGFVQPRALYSVDGVLFDTLEAAPASISLNGQSVSGAMLYNNRLPGTVWRVKPGDRLRLALSNKLPGQSTNLHFHGLHVDPSNWSDNVFAEIPSGATRSYVVNVPTSHNGGLNWYHPHFHGNSNDQVNRGLAGLIVIEGDTDQLPEVRGLEERLMALEYLRIEAGEIKPMQGTTNAVQLVNGALNPAMRARPGETQFFRVGNTSNSGWFKLAVDGHRMRVLAEDGNAYTEATDVDSFLLPPGKRVEFLVQFQQPGTYAIRNQGYVWSGAGGQTPAATLATVSVNATRFPLEPCRPASRIASSAAAC
ncbi:MAG: multicopper oxidase domain-containing protein [Pleurocapsa sp. SU_196_0]|nr:multicopper oxidase domain-containing protein [Pleurocapsa sp. SU_196_0]